MNKEHLAKLQDKVNRLIRTSSQESDSQVVSSNNNFTIRSPVVKEVEPETVRKCIDLIKENKQLKLMLEKQYSKNQQLRKELLRTKKEKEEQSKLNQSRLHQQSKINHISAEQFKKIGRLEVELQEAQKRNNILASQLAKQRKKSKKLYHFISNHLPSLQQNIDKLTANLDAKLEAHFSRIY